MPSTRLLDRIRTTCTFIDYITVFNWNVRGLCSQGAIQILTNFLHQYKPHIVTLQETLLKNDNRLYFDQYAVLRADRPDNSGGGGVAILVRRDVRFRVAKVPCIKPFECASISLELNGRIITVSSLYSPRYSPTFKRSIAKLLNTHDHFIFGDYNARHPIWNGSMANTAGHQLLDMVTANNIQVLHPPVHTYMSNTNNHSQSTIDHLVTNSLLAISVPERIEDAYSDHWAFTTNIAISFEPSSVERPDYKRANWASYALAVTPLVNVIEQPNTGDDVDAAIEMFVSAIFSARDIAIPKTTTTIRQERVPNDTRAAITELRRLKRLYHRRRFEIDAPVINAQIRCCRQLIESLSIRDRNARWTRLTSHLNENRAKCWKMAKIIRGDSSKMPSLRDRDNFITNNDDKAAIMATEFATYHTPGRAPLPGDSHIVRAVEKFLNRHRRSPQIFELITVEELSKVWRNLRPFKSPGVDGVPNILLKHLPMAAKTKFVSILNKCLELGYWPNYWKLAKVVCVPKRNKPLDERSSYRPISLLSGLSKSLERIIADRLNSHISVQANIIQPQQFGFRSGHSATQQALRIKQLITQSKQHRQSTGLILLDVKNAFPSVWVSGVLRKMMKFQFPAYLISIINAFCDQRRFFVQIINGKSPIITTNNGTPQGSCVSPILYAIFIADLKLQQKIDTALFADDTAFMAHGLQHRGIATQLSKAWNNVKAYSHKWRIQLNASKTEAILFPLDNKKKRRPPENIVALHPNPPNANNNIINDNIDQSDPNADNSDSNLNLNVATPVLNDPELHYSKSIKYLGIIFDDKMSFSEHMRKTNLKAIGILSAMYPLFASSSKLTIRTKLTLYKQIVRPIMTYGSPVWSSAANCHHKQLQVTQNRALKTIFGLRRRHSTTDLHEKAGVPMLRDYYAQLNANFMGRCAVSTSPLIRALAQ